MLRRLTHSSTMKSPVLSRPSCKVLHVVREGTGTTLQKHGARLSREGNRKNTRRRTSSMTTTGASFPGCTLDAVVGDLVYDCCVRDFFGLLVISY